MASNNRTFFPGDFRLAPLSSTMGATSFSRFVVPPFPPLTRRGTWFFSFLSGRPPFSCKKNPYFRCRQVTSLPLVKAVVPFYPPQAFLVLENVLTPIAGALLSPFRNYLAPASGVLFSTWPAFPSLVNSLLLLRFSPPNGQPFFCFPDGPFLFFMATRSQTSFSFWRFSFLSLSDEGPPFLRARYKTLLLIRQPSGTSFFFSSLSFGQ